MALASLGVLLAVDTAVWWGVTGRMMAEAGPGLAQAQAYGWAVTAGAAERRGWPLVAGIRLPGVSASRALGEGVLRWTAEAVDVSWSPLASRVVAFAPEGAQTLEAGQGVLPVRGAAVLRVRLDQAGPATLDVTGLEAGDAGSRLTASRVRGVFGPVEASLDAEGVAVTPGFPRPFEGTMGFSVRATLSVPVPEAASAAEAARAWQAAGGRAEVPDFVLRWGDLLVTGSASGGLDGRLQPEGQATLRVTGAGEVLEAAVAGGLVAPGPATAARGVLGLLTLAAQGGPVRLPVVLRDGTVSVAQFPLVRVPMVVWSP